MLVALEYAGVSVRVNGKHGRHRSKHNSKHAAFVLLTELCSQPHYQLENVAAAFCVLPQLVELVRK